MTDSKTREAFEARSQHSKRLLWKRGGSVFAEDVPEGDYVDAGVQHDWLLWQEAWQAARRAALEEAAQACEARIMRDNSDEDMELERTARAIRALADETQEGKP